jgi:hypothetical protein
MNSSRQSAGNVQSTLKYPLLIPFDLKDSMKSDFRIKWNSENKTWTAPTSAVYAALTDYHIKLVKIKYGHRDAAKKLGCKWNGTSWFTNNLTYIEHKDEFDKFETDPEPATEDECDV